jgi:hypothetical protein
MTDRGLRHLTVWGRIGVHLAAAMVTTWPLVARLGDGLPTGREPVATVPWFNLWSLQWTARQLPWHWNTWWDAPIFFPLPGSYARSELQPATGLLFGLLDRLSGPTVAYGLLVLLALTLNGLCANRLARRLGAGTVAAALAGLMAQTVPFLFDQLGVLQLLMLWPVLLAIDRVLAWADEPGIRHALAAGASLGLAFLTCSYHAALFGIAAVVAAPVLVRRSWRGEWRRRLLGGAAGLAVFAGIAAPFAMRQQQVLDATRWTDDTIAAGSARWRDLLPGGVNWPGTVLVAMAIGGVVLARRARATWFLVALVGVALLLSLGMHLGIGAFRPYDWLVDHVGVVARMRSPFRAVALAQVLTAVLAAPLLTRWWHARNGVARPALGVSMVLVLGTLHLGPGPIAALPDDGTVWSQWLRDRPGGGVAMMPMPVDRPVEVFEPTAGWMLQALDHGHPLLNGYTGFFPAGDRDMRIRMASFPDADTVTELRSRGVRYVVADPFWWDADLDAAARALGLTIVLGGPDGTLIDLAPDVVDAHVVGRRPTEAGTI